MSVPTQSSRKRLAVQSNTSKRARHDEVKVEEKKEFDMNRLLPTLHSLEQKIASYDNSNYVDGALGLALQEAKNAIPRVVVWGSQSAGKSNLLNQVFKLDLPVTEGFGTRCPIIFKFSPLYDINDKCSICRISTGETHWGTYAEAIKYVWGKTHGLTVDYTITVERKSTYSLVITDLPGVRYESQYIGYFSDLKRVYLQAPLTNIFHVVSAMVDPDADSSAKYLTDITNPIIPVITHTDHWINDIPKRVYLQTYSDRVVPYTATYVVLTNNLGQEVETLKEMNLVSSKPLIIGSNDLGSRISSELQIRTREAIPVIQKALTMAQSHLDRIFNSIGRVPPNFRELAGQFKEVMSDRIRREFNDNNTPLTIACNQSKNNINPTQLKDKIKLIPPAASLAIEMHSGSRNCLPGSEGWNTIIKKYSALIADEIQIKEINSFNSHAQVIFDATNAVIMKEFRSATKDVQSHLSTKLIQIVSEEKEQLAMQLSDHLNNISYIQYTALEACTQDYMINVHLNMIRSALTSIKSNVAPTKALDQALNDTRHFISTLIEKNKVDPYLLNAEIARSQLVSFWDNKVVNIHEYIVEQIGKFEREIEEAVRGEIRQVEAEDMCETSEVITRRSILVQIDQLVQDINSQLA
jgi:hypothetical protein